MKKRFAIFLIVLIGWVVSVSLSGCHKRVTHQETAANETEWMPDENLRRAVRRALKLGPDASLTPQALGRLTELYPRHRGIRSLKGLAYATRLKVLDLANNEISDITPLADLTGLQKLDLANNKISDITPLVKLTGLQELNLRGNRIQDVTVLYALRNPNLILHGPFPFPEPGLMPDGLLAEIVRGTLGLAPGSLFTREALLGLTKLAIFRGVTDLTGLEHATRLRRLFLGSNETDISQKLS